MNPTRPIAAALIAGGLAIAVALAGAPATAAPPPDRPDFAIAIHGGAGTIPKSIAAERKQEYIDALTAALEHGKKMLADGGKSIDVVEAVVRRMEDDPLFNAGKGAVFTSEGTNELDAAIMDGKTLACGAVSGIKTVKNPVSLARLVMEKTRHVFLIGEGAETFAAEMGVERVDPKYFHTEHRFEQWRKKVEKEKASEPTPDTSPGDDKGTVGVVCLDQEGNLAAATSTGGLTNKRFGRVGDVPIIGAGTYANNATCAVSCTGVGEEFIRHGIARTVAALIEYKGLDVEEAARIAIHEKLKPGDGGLIAVSHTGRIALAFNTPGMFRGAADATGRFEVKIWED